MTIPTGGTSSSWQADQFIVDLQIARDVRNACNAWLDELVAIKRDAISLGDVKGMGTLKSGQDLARKFSLKAVGGDDSLEKSLDSHIQAVTEMRDYFQACLDRYNEVEASNASAQASITIPR